MPAYTIQDIETLAKQNLITPQERVLLRQDFYQQATQEEGLLRKTVTHLSHEITEGWKHLSAGTVTTATAATSEKTKTEKALGPIEAIAGALQILSAIPTAAGHVTGETVQDFLLKRGANANVAALAATVADITVQMTSGGLVGKGIKKAVVEPIKGAVKKEAKEIVTSEQVKKAVVQWIEEKQNPANLVDVVGKVPRGTTARGGERITGAAQTGGIQLPGGGVMKEKAVSGTGQQKALPAPPDTEKAGKLIDEALQSGEPLDLGALQQAIQAPNPVQAIVQGLHRSAPANGAVKELDKMTFYRGTVPGETRRIAEPFEAAKGKTFVARKRESAESYGSDIKEYHAAPDAKILNQEDAAFWKLIGKRKPPNGAIESVAGGGKVTDIVNDAIRKAEAAGYDAISFSKDSDIGTVILNESKFSTGAQAAGPATPATTKVLKLTPADTLDMKKAMQKETDPYTLFSMATEQTTPRDIRQVAANRLNEVNAKDLSHFLLNEADPDFLKRISRSGMLPTTYTQFAKDKLKTLERAGLVGGGLDESRAGDIGAMATARLKFAEGMEKYEAGRINLKELHAEAQKSQMSMNDVLTLKPGVPKTPLEVAEISKPVRDFGESFIKNVDQAEAGIAKGDYGKFWEALSDFHLMVESHWPYMYPRQVAGQTLKTYDEPVLSATHFMQQIPKFSSWLAKLNLSDANEIEAAAPLIMREMQKIKAPGELSNFAKRIATETAEKGDEVLKDPTWRDKASFYFINSLMSGTDTIGRNLAGNTLAVPWHYAEKMTSTAASKVINPFLSAEHKLDAGNFSDANAAMGIWFRTMWDASRYTLTRKFDAMKGLVPDEAARAELLGNRFDLPRFSTTGTTNPIGGMAGKIIGTPVSIAQTADEVSRFAAYRMAIGEKLHQEWAGSGSKVPWRQYFDEGLDNTPPTVHEYGIRIANELTFSDQMTALGKVAMNARQNLPGTEFIVPFIKTTDRLTAYQYNRTPGLNLFSTRLRDELMSGDNAVKAEALGRVFLSGVMGAGIFAATRSDAPDGLPLITGGGPTDRKLMMKLKDANVLAPYTIWTPAGRFNYGQLAPMRGPMGMIADASEIWDEIKNPEEVTSLWSGIMLAGTRNFFDMSYTKQFADLMDMWDKPTSSSTNAFQRAGANLVKGFVEPSIVRQVLRTIDPSTKETHGFIDELARDVPGWGLPSRKNPLTGEPVLNPPRMLADVPGLNWFLPTSPIQPATDAFANKVRELGWRPPDLPKSFAGQSASESPFAYSGALGEAQEAASGVPIPRDLYPKRDQYIYGAEDTGQTLNDEAQKLVSDPEFSKLAPIDQADQLNALYRSRFSGAIERLKSEHPELTDAYELKMQTRAAVRMPPEEREAFQMTEEAPPDVPTPNFMPPEEAAPE